MPVYKSSIELLSENLQALMTRDGLNPTSLGRKADLDKNTITNILEQTTAAQLDTVDAIAKAFLLRPWQLLLDDKDLTKLLQAYVKSDDTGRQNILNVAEMAARPYHDPGLPGRT
jgi:hypothetical protein